jgi:hypothetical protein
MTFSNKSWVSWALLVAIQAEFVDAFARRGPIISHKVFARTEACKLAPKRLAENVEGVVYVNDKVRSNVL